MQMLAYEIDNSSSEFNNYLIVFQQNTTTESIFEQSHEFQSNFCKCI